MIVAPPDQACDKRQHDHDRGDRQTQQFAGHREDESPEKYPGRRDGHDDRPARQKREAADDRNARRDADQKQQTEQDHVEPQHDDRAVRQTFDAHRGPAAERNPDDRDDAGNRAHIAETGDGKQPKRYGRERQCDAFQGGIELDPLAVTRELGRHRERGSAGLLMDRQCQRTAISRQPQIGGVQQQHDNGDHRFLQSADHPVPPSGNRAGRQRHAPIAPQQCDPHRQQDKAAEPVGRAAVQFLDALVGEDRRRVPVR